jgi:NitT/TauT family transport system permease protein
LRQLPAILGDPRVAAEYSRFGAAHGHWLRVGAGVRSPIGLLMGRSRLVAAFFNPLLMTIYPVPKAALMPIIMLWLGIGDASKTLVIF